MSNPPSQRLPALSLVLATRGRAQDIARFLDALAEQELGEAVELIIVDQNDDDRVQQVTASRRDPAQIRLLKSRPGVSRARNLGLAAARGPIIGFPDDDCWYPRELLPRVLAWFEAHRGLDGLSCRVTDDSGRASAGGYMSRRAHLITRGNVWRSLVSPGLFIRRAVNQRVGGFDERLGVGAGTPWGSGEESDYVLRALAAGCSIFYEAKLVVLHPIRSEPFSSDTVARAWGYGQGMGFVLRANGCGPARAGYYATVAIGSAGLSCVKRNPGRAMARLAMSAGRISGWCRGARRREGRPAENREAPLITVYPRAARATPRPIEEAAGLGPSALGREGR